MIEEDFSELPAETKEFLFSLSRDDVEVMKQALPLAKTMVGFGRAMKWIAVTIGGLVLGGVMLWDAVQKLAGWIWSQR